MDRRKFLTYAAKQLIENGNLAVIDEVFSSNYVAHAEGKKHKGLAFIKRFSKLLQTSIPDITVLKIEIFAEENESITWQRTLQGTHQVNMMGIPPSRKVVKWNEMLVSRFEENKIAEEWIVSELMGQLLLHAPKKHK